MKYHGFPSRLHHEIPHWVKDGSLFHIRLRLNPGKKQRGLTDPSLAPDILESARFYESDERWHITLFLLMPDHIHALLSFGRDKAMSDVVSDWKRYQNIQHGVEWQENYFDHRLRDDERGEQLESKISYIRNNPVVAGQCARAEDWPWVIDPQREGDVS